MTSLTIITCILLIAYIYQEVDFTKWLAMVMLQVQM